MGKEKHTDFSYKISKDYGSVKGVVKLFMNLYKLQSGVQTLSPDEIIQINPETYENNYTFELRIKRLNKWESRRMTVSKIGESTVGNTTTTSTSRTTRGSKSICFKVIYDTLLVIKIPPSPITDFQEYIKSIKAEGSIAANLEPKIEYVAPGVTAILKKIHIFPDGDTLTPSELEKRYIRWLEKNPGFQEYLKIGSGFVFFMDLSKYSFLSQIIEEIHDPRDIKEKVQTDIIKSYDLLWDILGFEGKYGSKNISICFSMNKIYSEYESQVRSLLKKYELASVISSYQKQEWYLFHLAEKEIEKSGNNISSEFIAELNLLLRKIMDDNREVIEAYRKTVEEYVLKVVFAQNTLKMEGIIANLLDLLAWLNERGVAIRDLKPDNMFVVGDSAKHPLFLTSSEESSLGLIDFETAVVFRIKDQEGLENKIRQPLLGGTPSYSTPSHLFSNEVLSSLLKDLPRIFRLQDWYAVIGMIYNVIIGESLFEKTKKILPRIKFLVQKSVMEKQPLTEAFKKGSQVFWIHGVNELKERVREKDILLKSVEIILTENARKMFLQETAEKKEIIEKKIRGYIISQVIFNNEKSRDSLLKCSTEEIRQYKIKWEKGINIPKTSKEIRIQIIKLLRTLEHLKIQLEHQNKIVKMFEQPRPKLSAYELLEIMFNTVLKAMYLPRWGDISEEDTCLEDDMDEDIQTGSTVLYEATIFYESSG